MENDEEPAGGSGASVMDTVTVFDRLPILFA
jgi:hypothetical protein